MADQKLSNLSVTAFLNAHELYFAAVASSEKGTIAAFRNFLLGAAAREAVVAATTGDAALTTAYENGDTLDGVTLATADRILIKDQSAGAENGIYTVNASGTPTRATDFDTDAEAIRGAVIAVIGGTTNSNSWYMHTTSGAITLGSTALTFAQVGGGGPFTSHSDTPSSYTDKSRMFLRVSDAESAVEFVPEHLKEPVKFTTTAALTLASDFENGDSLDGGTLTTGDRILIKDQAAGAENGIYTVQATGGPIRVPDMDDDPDVVQGMAVFCLQGTVNANIIFQLTTTGSITLDVTTLTFVSIVGSKTFLGLTDTPSSYAGKAGQAQVVNIGETALEFSDAAGQPFKGALVKPAADITAADFNTAAASLACDEEVYDQGGWHDNSTNNSRLTIPAGVQKAKFKGAVILELGTADDFVTLSIRKNGSVSYDGVTLHRNQDDDTGSQFIISSPTLDVIVGDFFELFIEVETDNSVTVSEVETWFSGEAVETLAPASEPRGALVHKLADETANYSTQTAIPWDTEQRDTDDIHDNSTNNTRLTVPVGVKHVQLHGTVLVTGATAAEHANLIITKNGVSTAIGLPSTKVEVTDTTFTMNLSSPVLEVIGEDYFELELEIETDASITLDNDRSWFAMEITEKTLIPGGAGKQSLWIPSSAMQPTVSNGCAALANIETVAGQPDQHVLAFSSAADEHAQFEIGFPKAWDKGTVSFRPIWTHQGGQTGGLDGVAWALQGVSIGNDEVFAVAYGTPIVVTGDQANTDRLFVTGESALITIAGTPIINEVQFFRFFRDIDDVADDLDIDAQLIGLWLFFTTDKATDD